METINRVSRRCLFLGVIFLAFGCANDLAAFRVADNAPGQPRETSIWASHTGTDSARFSKLEQITPTNVKNLKPAWVFQTGDVADFFQVTPIISEGRLILCTPHNNVLALDPLTGAKLWAFDAQVPIVPYPNKANCRGLAQWQAGPEFGGEATKACDSRLFMATNTGQLLALDPESGALCRDFGDEGKVDLLAGVGDLLWQQEYQVTSPPAVVGDVVVVGSAVADNVRTNAPSGVVRGFDARSGALVWAFDLAPPDFDYERGPVSDAGYALGTPNVWAGMAVDEERDMVFLPTGNPSPDYYRGGELDMAYYGSAVLALRGSTGELLWRFKVVNRDFWDFDGPEYTMLSALEDAKKTPVDINWTVSENKSEQVLTSLINTNVEWWKLSEQNYISENSELINVTSDKVINMSKLKIVPPKSIFVGLLIAIVGHSIWNGSGIVLLEVGTIIGLSEDMNILLSLLWIVSLVVIILVVSFLLMRGISTISDTSN